MKMVRVLICGSRDWTDEKMIEDYILTLKEGSVIIEGECPGADKIAKKCGKKHGFEVEGYRADWDLHGDKAGPIRNKRMILEGKPDKVVAFHDDISKSRGTKDMINKAKDYGIPYHVRGHNGITRIG
jgi:hypothetical protein